MAAKSFKSTFIFEGFTFPCKVSKATEADESIKFNNLNVNTLNQLKQEWKDSKTFESVPFSNIVKGYELNKGEFIPFAKEEINSIDCKHSNLEVLEFVSGDEFDPTYIKGSYHIKPDQLGTHGYVLFAEQLATTNTIAIGYWGYDGKERLVAIRPYKEGLLMHELHYFNEVRDFENNNIDQKIDYQEKRAMQSAIKKRTVDFNMAKYHNLYAQRLVGLVNNKIKSSISDSTGEIIAALKAIKSN